MSPTAALPSVLDGVVQADGDDVKILDAGALQGAAMDQLVRDAVFADADDRDAARQWIGRIAPAAGAWSASIQDLYLAMGRGDAGGFTTPAINVRGLTYDVARTVFRTARELDAGAFIFEIARSEIGYTEQRPAEYAAVVMAAAVREGWQGPVFLQGDHFQVKAAKFHEGGATRDKEVQAVKDLTVEAMEAGFRNIDIDTSTLVTLDPDDVSEQQKDNYEVGAELMKVVRDNEHLVGGDTVSIGGEIGEVGTTNSTPEELRAYMDGLREHLGDVLGPSKISVNTGTSHGGIPMPDGSVKEVGVDFEGLGELSRISREEYGMAGAVQHGASTLPEEYFHHFPECGACEIHLATGFQNIIYDHDALPAEMKQAAYDWIDANLADERKDGWTDEQFYYKTRKKAFGPPELKRRWWDLDRDVRDTIMDDLQKKFEFLFRRLKADGTRSTVHDIITRD